jgi:hypothetical protein
MQIVRYAGLYARNIKRKFAEIARTALEALRLQAPLFDLASLPTTLQPLPRPATYSRFPRVLNARRCGVPVVRFLTILRLYNECQCSPQSAKPTHL